jgi:hypothetical protein
MGEFGGRPRPAPRRRFLSGRPHANILWPAGFDRPPYTARAAMHTKQIYIIVAIVVVIIIGIAWMNYYHKHHAKKAESYSTHKKKKEHFVVSPDGTLAL